MAMWNRPRTWVAFALLFFLLNIVAWDMRTFPQAYPGTIPIYRNYRVEYAVLMPAHFSTNSILRSYASALFVGFILPFILTPLLSLLWDRRQSIIDAIRRFIGWIEKRREAARQQHAVAVAESRSLAAAQRVQALKDLSEHASIVFETYALLRDGIRSEAERSNKKLVNQILYYTKRLGPERAIEFICIAPFWDYLISRDRAPFEEFIKISSISTIDQVAVYDREIAKRIRVDVRSVLEKLSTSASLDAAGPDWDSKSVLLGYQPGRKAIGYEGEGPAGKWKGPMSRTAEHSYV
jgi:hypothetical protein